MGRTKPPKGVRTDGQDKQNLNVVIAYGTHESQKGRLDNEPKRHKESKRNRLAATKRFRRRTPHPLTGVHGAESRGR